MYIIYIIRHTIMYHIYVFVHILFPDYNFKILKFKNKIKLKKNFMVKIQNNTY